MIADDRTVKARHAEGQQRAESLSFLERGLGDPLGTVQLVGAGQRLHDHAHQDPVGAPVDQRVARGGALGQCANALSRLAGQGHAERQVGE